MTGSLQIKKGKYYMVLNTQDDGKRKQRWIPTGLDVKGNKRKADEMLRLTLLDPPEEELPECDIYFHEYIETWLQRVKQRVNIVTYEGYEIEVHRYVLPYFTEHKMKLTEINRRKLQAFFDSLIKRGRLDGRGPLSPKTLRVIKNVVYQPLKEAVRDELISSNPCEFVELPQKDNFEASYYNTSQVKALFKAIEGDPLESMIKITALYGLRRSEALGIKWDSIDFETKRLTIKHTVVVVKSKVEKDNTKNRSSRRSFALTDEAMQIFEDLSKAEDENRRFFDSGYNKNDYVFKWPDGTPFRPDYVTRHFRVLLKKNGLPHIRFHELRHSCASMLLNEGFSLKDVQEYMGHADIRMTADLYGHLDVARKDSLARNLADSIFQ